MSTTDNQGKFLIDSGSLSEFNSSPITTLLTSSIQVVQVKKEGYDTITIPIQKGDGTPKENLGIVKLTPQNTQIELDKLKSSQFTLPEIELLSQDKKDWKYYIQNQLDEQIITLKETLIPVIIGLVAEFGISKATELIGQKLDDLKTCPNQNNLNKIIKRKNKLVKQLNNILKLIETTLKVAGITQGVIIASEVIFNILKNLPLPTSVPPGVGLPTNVLLGIQDNKGKIQKTIDLSKAINTSVLSILVIIRQNLILATNLLSMLDGLIQDCYPEAEASDISSELLELTKQQSQQQSPVVTNVNGFEMGVETEKTTSTLKRRRAIARNKGGVVMLKGEWSFSSIDQILIDELTFYIQTNDLKAD